MRTRSFVHLTLDAVHLALPLESVEHVVRAVAVTPLPGAPRAIRGAIDFHGTLLAVADIRFKLGLPPRAPEPADCIVIAHTRARVLAFVADAAHGVVDLPAESLVNAESLAPGISLVRDVARTANGLLLIQDLEAFLSADEEEALQRALAHG